MTTSSPTLPDLSGLGAARTVLRARALHPVTWAGAGLTVVLALAAGAGRIIAPLTVQQVIDHDLAPDAVTRGVLVGAVAVLVAGSSSWLLNRRLQGGIERVLAAARRQGLARVHDMSAVTADRARSADLVSRLTADPDAVTTFAQGGGLNLAINLAQLLIASVVMTVYAWQLAVPVFVLAVLLLVTMTRVQRVIARRFAQVRTDLSLLQSAITESVLGAPVIRSTGTQERTRARLDVSVDRARDSQLRTLAPLHGNTSMGELAISSMTVAVLLGGVWWSIHGVGPLDPGHLTSGQLVAMIFLVTFFVRPLQFLVQSLGEAQNALAGWRRTAELLATPSAVVAGPDAVDLPPGPIGVELRGVSASYSPTAPPALRDVTLRLEPGQQVAVVGRTGSGKSTLAKLLTRRLEPAAGTILLGDVDLTRVSTRSFARRVVIVPQEPYLFDSTIGDNIAAGGPDGTASLAEVERVVAVLGLDGWLRGLPGGLDAPVGNRGERLSVGERQLVALARTTLADPDLIVLDEATSGIDPATETRVQAALSALTRGRTSISIAHRMATAAAADRVLVLDEGRVVQDGTPAELAAVAGPYAGLVAAWADGRSGFTQSTL